MATKALQIKKGTDILHPETDVSQVVGLYDWAKQSSKPGYTASEVGAYTKGEIDSSLAGLESRLSDIEDIVGDNNDKLEDIIG